jgi:hypothetical protein
MQPAGESWSCGPVYEPADRRGRWSFRISAQVSELCLLMTVGYLRLPLNIGAALAAACLTLAACDPGVPAPPAVYIPPSMPTTQAITNVIKLAATEAHLTGPIEMSDLRPTDHGPGHFMLCMRGGSNDSRTGTYAVFFDNNNYMGLRLPVILDACEKQNYYPVPAEEPQKNMGPKPRTR